MPGSERIVVVGAGPAGLAVAASLRRRGVDALVLERSATVTPRWRAAYATLRVHTPASASALPGLAIPAAAGRYPTRDHMLAYFEAYAETFALRPEFGVSAETLTPNSGGWRVATSAGEVTARHVVVATGRLQGPLRADIPGLAGFPGAVRHSSEYRDPQGLDGGRVLVIGFRNSGADVAADLTSAGRAVTVSVRGPVQVAPRDFLGVPVQKLAAVLELLPPALADALTRPLIRLAVGRLERYGLAEPREGVFTQARRSEAIPYLDHGALALVRTGRIRVRPEVVRFEGPRALFADGTSDEFDALVLATGFRSGRSPLLAGLAPGSPGLHEVGFEYPVSGALRRLAGEARRVTAAIVSGRR